MKKVFIILIGALCFQNSFGQGETEIIKVRKNKVVEVEDNFIYTLAQNPPSYPGGDSAMFVYLAKQIKYPDSLKEKGIQGKVYCQFIVEKDGSITDEKIMRSPNPGFDPVVLNAIRKMPKWNPGMQREKAVRVRYVIPVIFHVR